MHGFIYTTKHSAGFTCAHRSFGASINQNSMQTQPSPTKQGYDTQQNAIRSSSPPPIMPDHTADDAVKDFFQWRINGLQVPEKRIKWRTAANIANQNDWSLDDLRAMADSKSHQYQLAIQSGISDGIARSFLKEIRAFKGEMKRTIDAASVLAGAAVSGGGFIPPTS
jgi:hypothetical protein